MTTHSHPPASTYRVQLSSSFNLYDLAKQVPYLAELGISDIYLSPIYAARPGSTHGYDIVDYSSIDPQLGGCDGWHQLCEALRAHSLGVVLDVVPNHMAADAVHNMLWRQVLGDGPSSPASRYFDVDWRPLTGLIRDKVLLPVLEEPYGDALMQGRVTLERASEEVRVRYGELHLPLTAGSIDPSVGDVEMQRINADPRLLHDVLEAQHYRLAYWRAASDEINYRRFFDVNHLIAVRAEDEEVFKGSHHLVMQLATDDLVHGLRIDHVDGLLDPPVYLQRLRAATARASGTPMWIVVEKILERSERLDPAWPVDGTTGYDALNVLNRLFISGRGVRSLRHFYQKLIDDPSTFRDIAYRSKRQVMERTLRSGLTLLAHAVKRVADSSWTTRDFTLNALSAALVEFIACLPVYRTYLGSGEERPADREAVEHAFLWATRRNPSMDPTALRFLRSLLLDAPDPDPVLSAARRAVVRRLEQYTSGVHAKGIEDTAYYRENTLLALNEVGGDPGGASGTLDEFHRFNEERARLWPNAHTTTSTHDTKLGEDTRIRLTALSTCTRDWISAVRQWTRTNAAFRQTTAKGSSPDANDEYRVYQTLIGLWPGDDSVGGAPACESLVERMTAYMKKAVREAQVHSGWIRIDEEYEAALDAFVRGILTDPAAAAFRCSLRAMLRRILPVSSCHSISQLVLKCFMSGVPDIYQGDEAWAFFVTDPDNRQAVDFQKLAAALCRIGDEQSPSRRHAASPPVSPNDALSDDLKQFVTTRLLRFRGQHRELLATGGYVPMRARGARASATIAFRRTRAGEHVVVVVPRLVERSVVAAGWPVSATFWADTQLRLPPRVREWTNLLSSQRVSFARPAHVPLAELTASWPWLVLYGRE